MRILLSIVLLLSMFFSMTTNALDPKSILTNKITNEKSYQLNKTLNDSNSSTNIKYSTEDVIGKYNLYLNMKSNTKILYEDKNLWTATASSSMPFAGPNHLIDSDLNIIWHSHYDGTQLDSNGSPKPDPLPQYFDIEFNTKRTISGITYTPRQDVSQNTGYINSYNVYIKRDKASDFELYYSGKNPKNSNDGIPVDIYFDDSIDCTAIRLEWVDDGKNKYATCAQFDAFYTSDYILGAFGYVTLTSNNLKDYISSGSPHISDKSSNIELPVILSLNNTAVNIYLNKLILRTEIQVTSTFTNESGNISLSDGGIIYDGQNNGNLFCAQYANGSLIGIDIIPYLPSQESTFEFASTPHEIKTFLLDENLNPLSSTLYEYTFD